VLLAAPGTAEAVTEYTGSGVINSNSALPSRTGDEPFRIALLGEPPDLELQYARDPPELANGVRILGYGVHGAILPVQSLQPSIEYRIAAKPKQSPPGYQLFRHLVDSTRRRLSQVDSPAAPPDERMVGDTFGQATILAVLEGVHAGLLWMRVGM
jgi:hypothetical protein